MRFLMVTSFYPPHSFGGDATYVRQLSGALADRGHEVRVVYCYDAYRMSGGLQPVDAVGFDDPVSVRKLTSRWGRLSALISQQTGRPGLKWQALDDEFNAGWDVVHFHNISLIGGPSVLAQSRAPVTLLTAHDHWLICATHILWKNAAKACDGRTCLRCQLRSGKPPQLWRLGPALSRGLAHVDRIFAPSDFTSRALAEQGIADRVATLPNFVPAAFDRQVAQTRHDRPGFLFVGRVTASKGIAELIALFRQRPGYDLRVVGDGDLLEPLKARFAGLANVQFLGRQAQIDLAGQYRNATALILPSLAPETFGLATIEALSQGTPAIVRDAGGAGEVVRQSGAGFVYRDDAGCLAAMDRLAGDKELRDNMGMTARAAYVAHYREATHLETYLSQINDLRRQKTEQP
jgi:glycosyltransferase involved in cell wall biosynthesis